MFENNQKEFCVFRKTAKNYKNGDQQSVKVST